MKPIHKHFPPQLAQMVVINNNTDEEELKKFLTSDKPTTDEYIVTKMNGSNYNLFIWLIYNTHKIYSDDEHKPTYFTFEYSDVGKH